MNAHRRASRLTTLAATSLAVLATGALAAPAAHADDSTPRAASDTTSRLQVVPLVQPSVVYELITSGGYVRSAADDGRMVRNEPFLTQGLCTGFVVSSDGWIATAGHCVDPAEARRAVIEKAAQWALDHRFYVPGTTLQQAIGDLSVSTYHDGDEKPNSVQTTVDVLHKPILSGQPLARDLKARVISQTGHDDGDAALLKVEATGFNALPISATSADINTSVTSVGYPGDVEGASDPDLTPTFNSGAVSSLKTIGDGLLKVYQLSSGIIPGMSGGPTVNDAGEVIGVNTSYIPGEQVAYAMPIDRIEELMAAQGVTNDVSETTQTYRAGIEAFYAGDKATAVADLTAAVKAQPGNTLARDYLGRAGKLADPVAAPATASATTSGSGTGILVGVGGGALLLLVGGAAAAVVTRRRPAAPLAPAPAYAPTYGQPYPQTPAQPAYAPAQPTPVPVGFGTPDSWGSANRTVRRPVADAAPLPGQQPLTHLVACGTCGTGKAVGTRCPRCGW